MKFLIFVFLCFSSSAFAAPHGKHGCMVQHLEEALALNDYREELYADLDWTARFVSRRMMLGEWLGLQTAAPELEAMALPYQEAGIPIMCDEFVPMDDVPPFVAYTEPKPDILLYKEPNASEMERILKPLIETEDFFAVADEIKKMIHAIEDQPRFNCMTRHTLESMLRTAQLAPRHVLNAWSKNLESPAFISKKFLEVQLSTLWMITPIDAAAAPIQAKGIAIICQDVPAVPVW